jgi:hypothetical protein
MEELKSIKNHRDRLIEENKNLIQFLNQSLKIKFDKEGE